MIRQLSIILFLITLCFPVDKAGTSAAKFLSIGVGGRAVGMGGAFTAIAADASAMFWNPAGVARISGNEFYVEHSNWLADINHNYLAMVLSLGNSSSWGLNIVSLSMPEMNVTRYGEEYTGESFRAGSYAIGATWAANLTDRFSIGFNGKYIREFISRSAASGAALDVGTLFNTVLGPTLGMSISNFGSKMQMNGADLLINVDDVSNNSKINADLSTEKFNLPLTLRFGISNSHDIGAVQLLWAVDAVSPMDNSEYVNMGFELEFLDKIYLRGGGKSIFMSEREELFTLGGGFKLELFSKQFIHIDYAYEVMQYLNDIHKFSISLSN